MDGYVIKSLVSCFAMDTLPAQSTGATMQPAHDASIAKLNLINRRASLFANLSLSGIEVNIDKLKSIIPSRDEFRNDTDETAPFSFFVQFAALIHETTKFHESYDYGDETNASIKARSNFVHWLAANLFKLNMHIASDPFALYGAHNASEIQQVNNSVLTVLGVDPETFKPMLEAFKVLRDISAASYKAHLTDSEGPSIKASFIDHVKTTFESISECGSIVGPALIIAIGYSQLIFGIGTTRQIADKVSINFTVESEGGNYKKGTLIHAYHSRFSKFSGSYAKWLAEEDGKITELEDVGDFDPNKRIIFEVDNQPVFVMIPSDDFHIRALGEPIRFSNLIKDNFPDKQLQGVVFAML